METVEILLDSLIKDLKGMKESKVSKKKKAEELVVQLIDKSVDEAVDTMSFEDLIYLQQHFGSLLDFLSDETFGERSIKLSRQCNATSQKRRYLL